MRLLALLAAIGVAALAGALPARALDRNDVYGIWEHPDNGSLIRIYSCGATLCAKIVWVADPKRTDIHNPDPALRKRPIVGIEIWRHARRTADFQWSGSSYNTLDGAKYYGKLQLTSPTTLVVAGCNLSVTPCFERTWTKASAETAKKISTLVSQPPKAHRAAKPVKKTSKAPAKAKAKVKAKAKAKTKAKAAKPKVPVKAAVEKPKNNKPVRNVAEPPKAPAPARVERSRDPEGYYDLPHIHINR